MTPATSLPPPPLPHTQVREVITPAAYGGAACGPSGQQVDCPVDCVMTDWSPWSACANKVQKRSRTITQQPRNNGAPCIAPFAEEKACSGCGIRLKDIKCTADLTKGETLCPVPAQTVPIANKIDPATNKPYKFNTVWCSCYAQSYTNK